MLTTVMAACTGGSAGPTDTPTAGEIVIAADESFRPLVEAEIAVFEGIYDRAKIDARWMSEKEAVKSLMDGEVRLAVVSRELTEEERRFFEAEKIIPRQIKVAEDAVALIINKANPDSVISMRQLEDLFAGRLRTWSDLRNGAPGDSMAVVFDRNGSSNFHYLLERFGVTTLEGLRIFAVQSNEQVIEYVRAHREAIGVIGVGWISDSEDPAHQQFLADVRLMAVAGYGDAPGDGHQPYQAYISLKSYPLTRSVYILSREARAGLGTGFISHVASDRGQRVVLKSGLLPSTMPVRIVGIKESF